MEASRSQHRAALSEAAFDDLVRTHRMPLERYARGLGASREDAEEIAATALLRAYQSPPAAHRSNEWRAWLAAVTRNLWIDTRRRRELRLVTGDGVLEGLPSPGGQPDQVTERAHEARQICAAMALLPPAQRAAIYLREVRGLSYEEIAAELGMTTSVVTATLQRARDNVKHRHGGIAHALSALAASPLALLRRAGRAAGAPGAAAKLAVPVVLVASAGGAGVLAATQSSTPPLRPAVAATASGAVSPAIAWALDRTAPLVVLPLTGRRTRTPATTRRARTNARPATTASPQSTAAVIAAGADQNAPPSADAAAGATPSTAQPTAPSTAPHASNAGGASRTHRHVRSPRDPGSASAHANMHANPRAGLPAAHASPRASAATARTPSPPGGPGAAANAAAHSPAAPGAARTAAGGAAATAAPPAASAPAAPAAHDGAQPAGASTTAPAAAATPAASAASGPNAGAPAGVPAPGSGSGSGATGTGTGTATP